VISIILGQYLYAIFSALLVALFSNRTTFGVLTHPDELLYVIYYLLSKKPQIPSGITPNQRFCYEKLTKVSRSFSAVILGLNEELREAVSLFYLVCRGLDTVEDDMKPPVETKVKILKSYHLHLKEPGWKLPGYGDKKDEIHLLENFDKVIDCLVNNIKPKYLEVIVDIATEMGHGMAEFLEKKVISMEDYNSYCWYVAGTVGKGLSRLFSLSGFEDTRFADVENLYKSMGLFLQKTNITRDYLEDIEEKPPRIFYPRDIWSKYTSDISDFKDPKNIKSALQCLNDMITDAMSHAVDCLDYLEIIKDPTVFKFCAIPQVMAIATLYECYNNPDVFKKEVKIRKPLAIKMIICSDTFKSVLHTFYKFSDYFRKIIPKEDPNAKKFIQTLDALQLKIRTHRSF